MQQVLKSWSALVGSIVFMAFSIVMAAIIGMHVLGGGLGHLDPAQRDPGESFEQYPRRNMETFSSAVMTCLQVMLADNWTEIMLWYMTHGRVGIWAACFFPVLYLWAYGILFNTFVAVLLINFAVDENDKMGLQRKIYWNRDAKPKPTIGMIIAKETTKSIMDDANDDDDDSSNHVQLKNFPMGSYVSSHSLFIFAPANPIRLQCAHIQDGNFIEVITSICAILACISLVQQGREVPVEVRAVYDAADYVVIGTFALEMLVKSIQGGFVSRSGPTEPYLGDPWQRVNFVVLVAMVASHVVGSVDESIDPFLRLLRGMAPMVGLMQIDGVADIANAFLQTLPAMATVVTPVFFVAVVFAIIGQDLFGGRLKRCICLNNWGDTAQEGISGLMRCEQDDEPFSVDASMMNATDTAGSFHGLESSYSVDLASVHILDKSTCLMMGPGYLWTNPPHTGDFDSVAASLTTLFKLISSGYVDLMENAMDIPVCPANSTDCVAHDLIPQQSASTSNVAYFLAFNLTFILFLMNLFIGVMSAHFSVQNGKALLTDGQKRHRQAVKDIAGFEPTFSYAEQYRPRPGGFLYGLRRPLFGLVTNKIFNMFCNFVIIANVVVLAMYQYPKLDYISESLLGNVNLGMNAWFTFEVLLRMLAFGGPLHYLQRAWNQFDLFIVIIAWVLIAGKAPSGLEALRVLRCLRMFALFKSMRSLVELVDVVILCIIDSARVLTIGAAIFYVYAVVGMKTFGQFGTLNSGDFDSSDFSSFPSSVKTLFQVMCGGGFTEILANIKYENLQSSGLNVQGVSDRWQSADVLAFLYFSTFVMLSVFIILNLFIVNVLDTFDLEMRIPDRTASNADLWGFAFCWSGLTLTTAACPSLQVADANDFKTVLEETLQKEAERLEQSELSVLVDGIPKSSLAVDTLTDFFDQFGTVLSVKIKSESQAFVNFIGVDSMAEDGMEQMLERPVVLGGSAVSVKRVLASYSQHQGVMVKLPGEDKDKTGRLTLSIIRVTGVSSDVCPLVFIRKCAKHLSHGGHHVEKTTNAGKLYTAESFFKEAEEDPEESDADDEGVEFVWGEGSGFELVFQVDDHTDYFEVHMYDSLNFAKDRWTAYARVELADVQVIGKVNSLGEQEPGKLIVDLKNNNGGDYVQLNAEFKYEPEVEGLPDWNVLTQFTPDNAVFKREECDTCGLDGWVFMRKQGSRSWKRTWMCVTTSPRRLAMIRDCSTEAELNELGREGKLQSHLVTIPAPELSAILSGHVGDDENHVDKKALHSHSRDFTIIQKSSEGNLKTDHGLLGVESLKARGLPQLPMHKLESTVHVNIKTKSAMHQFHRDTNPVLYQEPNKNSGDEVVLTPPGQLHIIGLGAKKKALQFSVFVSDGDAADGDADEICIGSCEVDVRDMADQGIFEQWVPIVPTKSKKQSKMQSTLQLDRLNMPGLPGDDGGGARFGELFIRIRCASKESARGTLNVWQAEQQNSMTDSQDWSGKASTFEFRTNSIERKDAWCRLINWVKSTHDIKSPFPPHSLRQLPASDLRDEDAKRCVNNPAL